MVSSDTWLDPVDDDDDDDDDRQARPAGSS
jgi:hypothetical protein